MRVGRGRDRRRRAGPRPLAIERDAQARPALPELPQPRRGRLRVVPGGARPGPRAAGRRAQRAHARAAAPWTPDEVELWPPSPPRSARPSRTRSSTAARASGSPSSRRSTASPAACSRRSTSTRRCADACAPPPTRPGPTCAPSRSPRRPAQPLEIACARADAGRPTTTLADAASRAPFDAPGLLAVPLETPARPRRRAGLRAPASRRSPAPSGRCSARSPPRPPRRGRRARRDARPARPGDPPPGQEQPADRGLAAAARRERRQPTRTGRCATSVGRVLSIAEVHDLLTSTREDDVGRRRPRPAAHRHAAPDARRRRGQLDARADRAAGRPGHRPRAGLLRAVRERRGARRRRTSMSPAPRRCVRANSP